MNFKINKIITLALSSLGLYLFVFDKVSAEFSYKMLEILPGVGTTEGVVTSFSGYVSGLFNFAIGAAIVLTVFQLSRGGFEYLTTEAFMEKKGAKEKITNALIGLFIALTAWILLAFINPDLVNTNFDLSNSGSDPDEPPAEVLHPPDAADVRMEWVERYRPLNVRFAESYWNRAVMEFDCKPNICGPDYRTGGYEERLHQCICVELPEEFNPDNVAPEDLMP